LITFNYARDILLFGALQIALDGAFAHLADRCDLPGAELRFKVEA